MKRNVYERRLPKSEPPFCAFSTSQHDASGILLKKSSGFQEYNYPRELTILHSLVPKSFHPIDMAKNQRMNVTAVFDPSWCSNYLRFSSVWFVYHSVSLENEINSASFLAQTHWRTPDSQKATTASLNMFTIFSRTATHVRTSSDYTRNFLLRIFSTICTGVKSIFISYFAFPQRRADWVQKSRSDRR